MELMRATAATVAALVALLLSTRRLNKQWFVADWHYFYKKTLVYTAYIPTAQQ